MYPAAYDHVMAVTATDQNDHKAYFASFGDWVDICAPGVNILAIYGDDYSVVSGTSFSAAMVAGLDGLVKAWYPAYSNDEIQLVIENAADPIDHLNPGSALVILDFRYPEATVSLHRTISAPGGRGLLRGTGNE